MRTEWRIAGRGLRVATVAEAPILVAIEVVRSFVAARVHALHVLRGEAMVDRKAMVEAGTGHVTGYLFFFYKL